MSPQTIPPGWPKRCSECAGSLTITRPGSTCGRCTQQLRSQHRIAPNGDILDAPPECPFCGLPLFIPYSGVGRGWTCRTDGPMFVPPTPIDLDQLLESA